MFNSRVLCESATEGMRKFLGAGTLLQAAQSLYALMWQVMQLLYTEGERKMEKKTQRNEWEVYIFNIKINANLC